MNSNAQRQTVALLLLQPAGELELCVQDHDYFYLSSIIQGNPAMSITFFGEWLFKQNGNFL